MAGPLSEEALRVTIRGLFCVALFAGFTHASAMGAPPASKSLFLDVFRAPDRPVVASRVEWESALGTRHGRLVRINSEERLPGLILIGTNEADEFLLQTARELAGIGYAVLLAPLEPVDVGVSAPADQHSQNDSLRRERVLAALCSAARWMRNRADVFPDKLGVLAWGKTARWALELAAAQSLQCAVLTDVELPPMIDGPLRVGLKQTAVLIIRGLADATPVDGKRAARLERDLAAAGVMHRWLEFTDARSGFMESRRSSKLAAKSADRAWFELYEFLGKHVEDAEPGPQMTTNRAAQPGPSAVPLVAIDDVMRAINGPAGLRVEIARSLEAAPRAETDWTLLRSRAAVMAESGVLLGRLKPPKGTGTSWQRHADAYRAAAVALSAAAEKRNLTEARRAFDRLNTRCAQCHADHR